MLVVCISMWPVNGETGQHTLRSLNDFLPAHRETAAMRASATKSKREGCSLSRARFGNRLTRIHLRRPRVRQRGGAELELPSWTAIQKADLLSRRAFNQMLIGVAPRKYARSVRLPDGDLTGQARRGKTKSSVSRRFVALSTAKLKEWLAADHVGARPFGDPDRRAACRRACPVKRNQRNSCSKPRNCSPAQRRPHVIASACSASALRRSYVR